LRDVYIITSSNLQTKQTTTKTKTNVNPILEGAVYDAFIDGIKSPRSKKAYRYALRQYMRYLKITRPDQLLSSQDPKEIQTNIVQYIMSLRKSGISYSTIKFMIAPLFTFYQLNYVVLNRRIVSRYMGENRRIVKDRPYTLEEIQKMVTSADPRMRAIILLLSSTGCRIGGIVDLTLGNLTKIPEIGLYKITFYEGTADEYYTFCTRECASQGIDAYLEFRKRCGERLEFNDKLQQWEPHNAPLFRRRFNESDILQSRRPKFLDLSSCRGAITKHLVKCGIRDWVHTETTDMKRKRKCNSGETIHSNRKSKQKGGF
jgi:integrase